MELLKTLQEQLFFYYKATDISLQLLDKNGNELQVLGTPFSYCKLIREACGNEDFCSQVHGDGCQQAAALNDGYVFSCPGELVHFSVPVIIDGEPRYSILAGPVALDYPEIAVIDNIIQNYGCSLNYRQKLYSNLSAIPIVEPVRLQYLSQLLFALVHNLVQPALGNDSQNSGNELLETEKYTQTEYNVTPILENALRYIDEHYRENLHLDDVAHFVGLNSSYFSTLFKHSMHINFSQYVTEKKIKEACNLLKNTNMSLVAISLELGFDNQSYFSRSFKKHIGMSPKQFRHEA